MPTENDYQYLIQNTAPWYEWRNKGIGSSDAAVLMCANDYQTIEELYQSRITGIKKQDEANAYIFATGHEVENYVRDIYEWETKLSFFPMNFEYKHWPIARYSSDGFNIEHWQGIEIKLGKKFDIDRLIAHSIIPPQYYAQLQWAMMCSESQQFEYVTQRLSMPNRRHRGQIHRLKVYPDIKYQREMLRRARWFWAHIEQKIPLKMRKARCIKF